MMHLWDPGRDAGLGRFLVLVVAAVVLQIAMVAAIVWVVALAVRWVIS